MNQKTRLIIIYLWFLFLQAYSLYAFWLFIQWINFDSHLALKIWELKFPII